MDRPTMQDVVSTNVKAIGHHADRNELHVDFKSGDQYVYHGVPSAVASQATAAPSVGSFLAKNVKGKFKHEKL